MKLNYKRTMLVGLAFLSISAFWQMYDFTIPLLLKNTYKISDTLAGVVMAMDNVLALFLLPWFGALSDRCGAKMGRRMPFILAGTGLAVALLLLFPTVIGTNSLPLFFVVLGVLLVAMGLYRSPAVALMPDVTPKPLRSKGNAIINLMGTVGGMLALVLNNVAIRHFVNEAGEKVSDYTFIFYCIAAIMAISVFVLYKTIRERPLVEEMERINYGETAAETAVTRDEKSGRMNPEVVRSLLLILFSVAFWYMGYNAVITAFSKYAITQWQVQEGTASNCMLLATVIATLSFWPVGIISSKLGRKKVILAGAALLSVCFFLAGTLQSIGVLMFVLFALIGIAWASINVNSFPMVVELATGADTGKYTGYYYTFSMAAQVLTPIISGWLLEHVGYHTLFPYAGIMVAVSVVTMCFVKHGDAKPEAKHGLEAFDAGDD
ncbi:MAG: MFS transporter [Clostridia bacterium]|nr:MFS transporter [Clostridia bacterium]